MTAVRHVRTDDVDGLTVADVVTSGPTIAPDAPAAAGRDLVEAASTRRVPVVDRDGRLVGVLALTHDRLHFACR